MSKFVLHFISVASLFALTACGGGSSATSPTPSKPSPTLTVTASTTEVLPGDKPVTLTGTANAEAGTLTWSLGAGDPGSLSTTSGATATYVPPATVSNITPVTVTASGSGISKSFRLTAYPDPGAPRLTLLAGDINGFYNYTDWTHVDIDGVGAQANFVRPGAMGVAPDGTLYVVENNRVGLWGEVGTGLNIRRIRDGVVSTIVLSQANANDPASVLTPAGIAVDRQGNIYVGSRYASMVHGFGTNGGAVVMVKPSGEISNFAGVNGGQVRATPLDGSGTTARFADPQVLGFDADGNLYVDDSGIIRKITAGRVVTTVAALPASVGSDPQGNHYRITEDRAGLEKVAPDGSVTRLAGSGESLNRVGPLPGAFTPQGFVRTGPKTFAITSGIAVLQLVVP